MSTLSGTTSKNLWPFSPQSIPGLSLWLDGSDTSSITLSGSNVTAWKDKSSTGNNFTGTASYALDPVYNKYGLSFNGTSNYFSQVNGSLYSITNTTYTIFTVHRFYYDSPSNGVGEVYRQVGGLIWFRQTNYPRVEWITDTTYIYLYGNAAALSGIGCINTLTTSSATAYLNGTSVGSASRGTTTNVAFGIGHYSGTELFQGAIFEMLVFNTTISTSQQQQVEGYLAQKWGLQGSLPATHPYYAAIPSPGTVAVSSPTAISGLKLWLDAADASTVTGTTSVTAWADKSGTSNNMSVTSGPISYASNTMTFASGGIMSSANSTSVIGSQSVVFVVCQPTTIPGAGIGYVFVCSNLNGGDFSIRFPTTTSVYATNGGDLGYSPGTYYINGTLGVPSGGTIAIPSTPNIIYGLFRTGGTTAFALSSSYLSRYFIGNLYEVIVYTGPITSSQRASVELYLSQKWGIAVTSTIAPTLATQLYQRPVFQRTFQPVDIPGCSLWLDGADTSSLTLSGSNVTAWNDKSGNGYNATTGQNSPTFITSGGISFNGTQLFSLSAPYSQTASTFFLVGKANAGSGQQYFFNFDSTNNGISVIGNGEASGYIDLYSNPVAWGRLSTTGSTNIFLVSESHVLNGNYIGLLNGSQIVNSTYNAGAATSITCLGSPYNYGTVGGNVSIYEFILFNSVLSSSQRQQVESYLAWKWGLVSSLPASPAHPGKLLPSFSTVFTPKSISGVQLWLDGADTSSLTLSGSNVTAWNDKSGNGYTATGVNSPQKLSSGGVSFNAASSQYFTMAVPYTTTNTVFMVASPVPSITTFGYYMNTSSPGNRGTIYLGGTSSAYVSYYLGTNTPEQGVIKSDLPTSPFLVSSIKTAGVTNVGFYNGGQAFSMADNPSVNAQFWGILGGANATEGLLTANIYEMIIFNTALTTSQRQQVEGYLAWKWGLQNNLPDTHAYKKIKP